MKKIVSMLLGALLLVGCSKKEAEEKPPVAPSQPVKHAAPVSPLPPDNQVVTPAQRSATETNTTATVDAGKLETEYVKATDLVAQIAVLSQLPDAEPQAAVVTLGRLFQTEEDTEMREEIIHTLLDIDGQTQAKLDLLTLAIQADQPESVRDTGIRLMIELGNPQAIPILQNLLTDPSAEIRDAAIDAVEQLQNGQ